MGSSCSRIQPTVVDVIEEKKDLQMVGNVDVVKVANAMVQNNWISKEEATTQLDAITKFRNGQMSYAEMRMIAG